MTTAMLTPTRVDIYNLPHKALRRAFGRVLATLGASHWQQAGSARQALAELENVLQLSDAHAAAEEAITHAALAQARPDLLRSFEQEHAGLAAATRGLRQLADQVARAPEREELGRRLYVEFGYFMADQLDHMAREEERLLPIFHEHFSDAELRALEGRVMAGLKPDLLVAFVAEILPAATAAEREALLRGASVKLPRPLYEQLLHAACRDLPPAQWLALAKALGVDPDCCAPALLQIDFAYPGPWGRELTATYRMLADSLNELPGLRWKFWSEDRKAGRASGVYLFETAAQARTYVDTHVARLPGFGISDIHYHIGTLNTELSLLNNAPLS